MRNKHKLIKIIGVIFKYIILSGFSFIILYPLFIKISVSFMSLSDLNDSTIKYFSKNFTIDNYINVMQMIDYFKSLIQTTIYTFGISLVQILAATSIAYGFARFKFVGNNILFLFVFLILIIPPQTFLLPLYFYFKHFKLLGTIVPIFAMSACGLGLRSGLLIFILRQFFTGIPKELEESGEIDGASTFHIFIRLIVPNAIPMMITGFLFSFVWQWTDSFYLATLIPDNTLLQTQLLRLVSTINATLSGGVNAVNPYMVSMLNNSGIVLFILPLILLYIYAQKYFVESIERTGIVG